MKTKSAYYNQAVALLLKETEDLFIFTIIVKSAKGEISTMTGEWNPEFAIDGEMNIQWGIPAFTMENVENGSDFKKLSQKAINFANNHCLELLNDQQSKKTGGDQFGL